MPPPFISNLVTMTALSLSSSVRRLLSNNPENVPSGISSRPSSDGATRPLPRISIRKRPHKPTKAREDIPYVTSAFLSNLFADAAEASSSDEKPCKKARLTKTKSQKSFFVPTNEIGSMSTVTPDTSFFGAKQGQTRVECAVLGADASSATDTPIFPTLPTTVSDDSCAAKSLSLVRSDRPMSTTDTTHGKDSYGWFVETDSEIKSSFAHEDSAYGALSPSPANDLAFGANTARKESELDAEVEWAKAADTVDDVLGDFF